MRCLPLRLLAVTAAFPLGGCVAAAIPLVAAGGLVQSQRSGADESTAPSRSDTPAAAARGIGSAGDYTVLASTTLPAPGARERETSASRRAWDAFYSQALAAADPAALGGERHSALLATPGSLTPQTAACGGEPPAVLVDLDPAGRTFDPATATAPSPRLAQALAVLRSRGLAVVWISGNYPDAAPAIRKRLQTSGLDPEGRDEVLLLRYPDERKQERREAIAAGRCVVAIAGDERADFDELFAYLKDPDAAVGLEPLVGKVWFLTPNPLS